MAVLYWEISGYDRLKTTFEKRVPVGCFTDVQAE
jgi:hypothetical protein